MTLLVSDVELDGRRVDVTIEGSRISRIERAAEPGAVVRRMLPAAVDLHTHLRQPGGETAETIATGTRAAAAGGFAHVFAMANTSPVTDTVARVRAVRDQTRGAAASVHVNAAATVGLAGAELVNVEALAAEGVRLFSDDGHCVQDDGLVLALMRRIEREGAVFAQHAQSSSIVGRGVVHERVARAMGCEPWPAVGEEAVIARDVAIARATGAHLHVCHVSTERSADIIAWAKSVGVSVTAEVTPHHLSLTDLDAAERGPALKVNPPLRTQSDVRSLRAALREGIIDAVATDHAPHPAETKSGPWDLAAFGMTGLETALPLVAEVFMDEAGTVDWDGLVSAMSLAPARIGGLADEMPHGVAVGAIASFVIVEDAPWTVDPAAQLSRSRNTPYGGRVFAHRVVQTMVEGRITFGRGA